MVIVLALCFLCLGVQLITLALNLREFPVLGKSIKQQTLDVSILIPARNEALTLPETLPRVLKQAAREVIVLNDESTDGTKHVLAGIDHPRLRCIQGQALPKGWSGKNWACHQLAQVAKSEVIIFTDADVYWEEETLSALLAFKEKESAGFVSVWPKQLTRTWPERILVPIIDVILLGSLPYWGVRKLPFARFAAGNGQLMLWDKLAYDTLGGHEAFKDEVLEDVRMGQAAKAKGIKVALALGGKMISTRMYRSGREVIAGFSKNILAGLGYNSSLLLFITLLNTLIYTLSLGLGFVNPWWFLLAGLGMLQRGLTSFKSGRSLTDALLQPLVPFVMWPIVLRALKQGRAYHWKGRQYL